MGFSCDPGEVIAEDSSYWSFEEFQRQTTLMTTCTLLWKELSDHFTSLEQNLQKNSDALKHKIRNLDRKTKESQASLKKREVTIDGSIDIAMERVEVNTEAAIRSLKDFDPEHPDGEVDNDSGLLLILKPLCLRMEARGFWKFVTEKKKEIDLLRKVIPVALTECVDPPRFVLEVISEVFPFDTCGNKGEKLGDLSWACVLVLEGLIPVMVDPVIGKMRMLVTPMIKKKASAVADAWKNSLDKRCDNVKTPDVHTFLQLLITFGIQNENDMALYRRLIVASAWRRQMPKLALSLGLGDIMPDIIEELISKGQQIDAVHFSHEVGLVGMFPPVPLLKAFLKDATMAVASILEDSDNGGRAMHHAVRKERSALQLVIKCIEEYQLEPEFPSEMLKRRLEQLDHQAKMEKKHLAPADLPANKRTRAPNAGHVLPPAKAGRSTVAHVSSLPPPPPSVFPLPSFSQCCPTLPTYSSPPVMYGPNAPPFVGHVPIGPLSYPAYCGYVRGLAQPYHLAFYR